MGKGKKPGDNAASEHVSRPLSSLKDPSSFGPPPKNVNYHGGAALPNEITPHRGGIGAPLTQEQIESANRAVHGPAPEEVAEQEKKKGPALPYRANTTGLNTDHLPPPPVHRNIISPPPAEGAQPPKPKPGLPPRLPARQNTAEISPIPPPSYDAVVAQPAPTPPASTAATLNQSAMSRLGKAGVNVPSLGIGRTNSSTSNNNPWSNEPSQSQSQTPNGGNTMSELQSRFARMNSNDSSSQAQSPSAQPTSPPTLQQSQSAFNTAQNFRRDPSSVSVNDAKDAANTANTAARSASAFRDKHAGSIAAAEQRGRAFNNKYQIQSRFERFLDKHAPLEDEQQQQQGGQPQQNLQSPSPPVQSPSTEMAASISRKPPPPPPPKKPAGMHGNSVGPPPPPVPLGTKPSYS
jgi:hypothetical protein